MCVLLYLTMILVGDENKEEENSVENRREKQFNKTVDDLDDISQSKSWY